MNFENKYTITAMTKLYILKTLHIIIEKKDTIDNITLTLMMIQKLLVMHYAC